MIQGGMNLVWTTHAPFLRVVCDRVFCDGAANEGVAGADTHVTAASGLRTSPAVKPTKHAQVPPRLTVRVDTMSAMNLSIAKLLVLGQKLLHRDFNKTVAH